VKSKTLQATQQISAYLSLNLEVDDDGGWTDVIALPLVSLTWLLTAGWFAQKKTVRLQRVIESWTFRLQLVWTIVEIGYRSIMWGVATPRFA
jgi:hypothetical protein